MLTAEERSVLTRARGASGRNGNRASRRALDTLPTDQPAAYPAGASTRTLGLLGKVDALLKAQPQPPRSALLRVLALLEEEREREAL